MGVSLSNDVRDREQADTLREIARATHKPSGKVLAVCETATGEMVLARERTVGQKDANGKRSRENGTEQLLKRTSALADFAHALAAGLIEE